MIPSPGFPASPSRFPTRAGRWTAGPFAGRQGSRFRQQAGRQHRVRARLDVRRHQQDLLPQHFPVASRDFSGHGDDIRGPSQFDDDIGPAGPGRTLERNALRAKQVDIPGGGRPGIHRQQDTRIGDRHDILIGLAVNQDGGSHKLPANRDLAVQARIDVRCARARVSSSARWRSRWQSPAASICCRRPGGIRWTAWSACRNMLYSGTCASG